MHRAREKKPVRVRMEARRSTRPRETDPGHPQLDLHRSSHGRPLLAGVGLPAGCACGRSAGSGSGAGRRGRRWHRRRGGRRRRTGNRAGEPYGYADRRWGTRAGAARRARWRGQERRRTADRGPPAALVPRVDGADIFRREVAEDDGEAHLFSGSDARTAGQGRAAAGRALRSVRRASSCRHGTGVTGRAAESATTLSRMACTSSIRSSTGRRRICWSARGLIWAELERRAASREPNRGRQRRAAQRSEVRWTPGSGASRSYR